MQPIHKAIQKGFTLVELLIVVIILALLAAIVVPQFASSTDDAKAASLDTTLGNLRSAIDLYFQQHGEYPSAIAATGGALCAAGTAGAGAINTDAAFFQQLAYYTDADGAACTQKNGTDFPYGPYLKKDTLPGNPITTDATLVVVNTGDLNLTGTNPAAGWRFDNGSGKFIADDSIGTDAAGDTWDTH
jgi:prepilin-type N-terminal cleavage/methylation domain-containing protein